MDLKDKLTQALWRYDQREAKGKYYNPNAIFLRLDRLDLIMEDIENGASPKNAIMQGFIGGARTACLKAIGEKADHSEPVTRGFGAYVPSSELNK